MLKVAVLADTHIPKRAKTIPDVAWELVRSADIIVHAGDVLTYSFLDQLRAVAPVYVVRGNNDLELADVPEAMQFDLERVKIGLIHDSGARKGREQRMQHRFPTADIVIFGHSHIPWNERTGGQLLFNPGSATDRRRQPCCTMGMLYIDESLIRAEIVKL